MDSLHKLTPALADELAAALAPEHVREIRELAGLDPRTALRLSLNVSLLACAALDCAGKPVFAIGVEPAGALTGTAQVWMVGTPAIPAHARTVLRAARRGLEAAFRATGAVRLEQYIPVWYATGLRFAKRLGFRSGTGKGGYSGARAVHVILEKENAWAYPRSRTR